MLPSTIKWESGARLRTDNLPKNFFGLGSLELYKPCGFSVLIGLFFGLPVSRAAEVAAGPSASAIENIACVRKLWRNRSASRLPVEYISGGSDTSSDSQFGTCCACVAIFFTVALCTHVLEVLYVVSRFVH